MKYSLLTICLVLLISLNGSSQIINGNFEDWELDDGTYVPSDWETLVLNCPDDEPNLIDFRDEDSLEGEYSLKLTGYCYGTEGGKITRFVDQFISLDENTPVLDKFSFYYKLKNVLGIVDTIACGWAVLNYIGDDGGFEDYWYLETDQEVDEWTYAEIDIPELDFVPTSLSIHFGGGSCADGLGSRGNGVFLFDGLGFDVISSSSHLKEEGLEVFPNPTNNHITIKSGDSSLHTCALYNSVGQRVVFEQSENISTLMNVAHLASGVYYLHVTLDNGVSYGERIIIQD